MGKRTHLMETTRVDHTIKTWLCYVYGVAPETLSLIEFIFFAFIIENKISMEDIQNILLENVIDKGTIESIQIIIVEHENVWDGFVFNNQIPARHFGNKKLWDGICAGWRKFQELIKLVNKIKEAIQDISETYVIKSTPASKESQFSRENKEYYLLERRKVMNFRNEYPGRNNTAIICRIEEVWKKHLRLQESIAIAI